MTTNRDEREARLAGDKERERRLDDGRPPIVDDTPKVGHADVLGDALAAGKLDDVPAKDVYSFLPKPEASTVDLEVGSDAWMRAEAARRVARLGPTARSNFDQITQACLVDFEMMSGRAQLTLAWLCEFSVADGLVEILRTATDQASNDGYEAGYRDHDWAEKPHTKGGSR